MSALYRGVIWSKHWQFMTVATLICLWRAWYQKRLHEFFVFTSAFDISPRWGRLLFRSCIFDCLPVSFPLGPLGERGGILWAGIQHKGQVCTCVHRRFKSICASKHSDQYLSYSTWGLLALVCSVWLWSCHFPIGVLGQVWCLIVSIPDLCPLSYFGTLAIHSAPVEDSDQTALMRRLIWVFGGHKCQHVPFSTVLTSFSNPTTQIIMLWVIIKQLFPRLIFSLQQVLFTELYLKMIDWLVCPELHNRSTKFTPKDHIC